MAITRTLDKGCVPVKIWTNDIGPLAMAQLEAEQPGYGGLDYAALAKLWESWCDLRFA